MAFGKKVASDARDGGGEWIRRFADGDTNIRILPAQAKNAKGVTVYGTSAWVQEREHFDKAAKLAYPCTEEDDCIGCTDSDKEVQKRTAKVYFHALDEEGNAHIYKIGRNLYKRLKAKEQRALARDPKNLQPLSDRDYAIIRSGSGLETDYDADPGDAYEIDFPDASELPDIGEALSDAYRDAMDSYGDGGTDDDDEEEEEEAPVRAAKKTARRKPEPEPEEEEEEEEPAPRKRAAAKRATKKPEPEPEEEEEEPAPAPRKRAAKKAAKPEPEPEPEEEEEEEDLLPDSPTEAQVKSASTEALRAWLDNIGAEYPPRAPRRRLVEIALEQPPF